MQVTVREVSKPDNPLVAEMIRQVFVDFDAKQEGTVFTDPTTDSLFEFFKVPNSVLYVVETEGEIHGCCGIYPTQGLPENCVELVKFYVSSKLRGKGYGRQLFAACEQKAKEFGYKEMYIESMDDFKKAVTMYKKMGFKTLSSPMGNSGHFGCDIWMSKSLV